MDVHDENDDLNPAETRVPAAASPSNGKPARAAPAAPADPAERPTIEPSDALPSDRPDQSIRAYPAPPTASRQEPAPPPTDPAERPTIEPGDAKPTDE